jgi:hypothetical protein
VRVRDRAVAFFFDDTAAVQRAVRARGTRVAEKTGERVARQGEASAKVVLFEAFGDLRKTFEKVFLKNPFKAFYFAKPSAAPIPALPQGGVARRQ